MIQHSTTYHRRLNSILNRKTCNRIEPIISNTTNICYEPRNERSANTYLSYYQTVFYFSQSFSVSISCGYCKESVYCSGALINENWVITSASCYKSLIHLVVHLGGPTIAQKQMYFNLFIYHNFYQI